MTTSKADVSSFRARAPKFSRRKLPGGKFLFRKSVSDQIDKLIARDRFIESVNSIIKEKYSIICFFSLGRTYEGGGGERGVKL